MANDEHNGLPTWGKVIIAIIGAIAAAIVTIGTTLNAARIGDVRGRTGAIETSTAAIELETEADDRRACQIQNETRAQIFAAFVSVLTTVRPAAGPEGAPLLDEITENLRLQLAPLDCEAIARQARTVVRDSR